MREREREKKDDEESAAFAPFFIDLFAPPDGRAAKGRRRFY